MGFLIAAAPLPPLPSIIRRDAPVPRVSERMQDARVMCSKPPPAPPLSAAARPPCPEALDELEREIDHEHYLHARTVFRLRCLLKVDRCDGERDA